MEPSMKFVMKNTKKSITFKVLIGYLLVSALSVFAVWVVYGQIVNLTKTNRIGDINNQKLILISEAVTNLYVAEGISRTIIQNEKPSLLPVFHDELDTIAHLIDSLKQMYTNEKVRVELDSIIHLLDLKENNLKELLAIREEGASKSLYSRVMEKLKKPEDRPNYEIYEGNLDELDPSVRALILRRRKYLESVNWNKQKSDSSYQSMKKVLKTLDSENEEYNEILNRKENELLQNDRQISLQLRNIRSEIEQEEIQNSVAQVAKSQQMLEKTATFIAVIGAGSILTIILFVLLIIRDTNRSQKYRQELEQAKNFAESLLKGREQIMATVTHDLRSPLNSIMGYSDLLAKTSLNEKQNHYLGHLKKSSDYILRLVNDLLDLSKLEVGKMTIEVLPFLPESLIMEALGRSIPAENTKKIKIITTFDDSLNRQVASDPFRIQQILNNLISNAYKFTEEGSIEVQARIHFEDETNKLEISVSDTGIGISEEQETRIFEEFSQAENSFEKKYGGFGLGLAISKKLTQLLGGEMWLESTPGIGSTFHISLPVQKMAKNSIASEGKRQKAIRFRDAEGKKILIVDDEPSQLALTSEIISQSGLVFDACASAVEALEKMQAQNYDLVLTDIQMPEMDGFAFIKKIKSLPEIAKTPVIALSGRAEVTAQTYLDKGFTAGLVKPYDQEEFLHIVGTALFLKMEVYERNQSSTENKATENKAYDLSDLYHFIQNDEATLQEIIDVFIESTTSNMKLMEVALTQKNTEEITSLAHKMLPMFKQLKIYKATAILEDLEKKEKKGLTEEQVKERVFQLQKQVKQVLEALQKRKRN